MTIRQRLTFSFALILALFAANLVVYFWSSQKRTAAVEMLQHAVTREVKILTIRKKVSDVKTQIAFLNDSLAGPGGIEPEVARGINSMLASFLKDARDMEKLAVREDARRARQFVLDCEALANGWRDYVTYLGKDQARAITALSGEKGADYYSRLLLEHELPTMQRAEERRMAAAGQNITAVARLTYGITVVLFLASILVAAIVAYAVSSYLSRGFQTLGEGAAAIGKR
jgi:hypothetical protein